MSERVVEQEWVLWKWTPKDGWLARKLTPAEVLAELGGQHILWCETHQPPVAASGHYCLGWSVNAGSREVEAWMVVMKEDDDESAAVD